jgi:hypothetical protein
MRVGAEVEAVSPDGGRADDSPVSPAVGSLLNVEPLK